MHRLFIVNSWGWFAAGTTTMLEIIIQGRGGQGAQTAGTLLAKAFFSEGKYVQSFATYGGARRGTPVSSFIRIDDRPIRLRCDIEHPHAILCFDASLLQGKLLDCATADTLIVVNSTKPADQYRSLGDFHIFPIDGLSIARDCGLGRIVNSTLLGALACALQAPDIGTMQKTISAAMADKTAGNIRACLGGFDHAREIIQRESIGVSA